MCWRAGDVLMGKCGHRIDLDEPVGQRPRLSWYGLQVELPLRLRLCLVLSVRFLSLHFDVFMLTRPRAEPRVLYKQITYVSFSTARTCSLC